MSTFQYDSAHGVKRSELSLGYKHSSMTLGLFYNSLCLLIRMCIIMPMARVPMRIKEELNMVMYVKVPNTMPRINEILNTHF